MKSIIDAQKCGKNVIKIVFDNTPGRQYLGDETNAYRAKYPVDLSVFEREGVNLDKPYKIYAYIKSETFDWSTTQVKPTDIYSFNVSFDNGSHFTNSYQTFNYSNGNITEVYDLVCRIKTSLHTYNGTNYVNTYYESAPPEENGYKYVKHLRNINFLYLHGYNRGLGNISTNAYINARTQYTLNVYLVED